jgi:hypothetical protein
MRVEEIHKKLCNRMFIKSSLMHFLLHAICDGNYHDSLKRAAAAAEYWK